jgi:Bacteriocin-protection, YdeI or OmpD-Associated
MLWRKRFVLAGLMGSRSDLNVEFVVAEDILAALQANPDVWSNYLAFPDLYRRVRIGYIEEMRKNPTEFDRRLQNFIGKTAANKLFGNWQDASDTAIDGCHHQNQSGPPAFPPQPQAYSSHARLPRTDDHQICRDLLKISGVLWVAPRIYSGGGGKALCVASLSGSRHGDGDAVWGDRFPDEIWFPNSIEHLSYLQ